MSRSSRRWRASRTICSISAPTSACRADEGEKPGVVLRIAPSQVEALERAIDALNAKLDPLRSFVLPGGTARRRRLASGARCLPASGAQPGRARRAIEGEEVGEAALAYVNRLSDYLFVAARAANDVGKADVLWAPGANQSEPR